MPYRLLDPSAAQAAPVWNAGAPLVSVGETRLSAETELALQLASRSDATPDRIRKWMNWAYKNLAMTLKLKELYGDLQINLAVDQPFYLLPKQVASIVRVRVVDSFYQQGGRKLTPIDEEQYAKLPDTDERPTNYFRAGRMLVMYPDPTEIVPAAIHAKIRPDDLSADNHSPILPEEWHEPWILLSRHRAWRSLQDFAKAREAKNDYLDAVKPLLDTDAEEHGELPSGMQYIRNPADLVRIRPSNALNSGVEHAEP